jgi:hypothetical protein
MPPGTSLATLPDGLSVDVEDYFHVEAFADRILPEDWPVYLGTRGSRLRIDLVPAETLRMRVGCIPWDLTDLVRLIIGLRDGLLGGNDAYGQA